MWFATEITEDTEIHDAVQAGVPVRGRHLKGMRMARSIVGGVLFALGGLMVFSCLVLIPTVWGVSEYRLARLVTHFILLGMFSVVTWTGWKWVRRQPDAVSVMEPVASGGLPNGPTVSPQAVLPESASPTAAPKVIVVLQNAPSGEVASEPIIHIRCSHCGTTTPESERCCGQCGAALR